MDNNTFSDECDMHKKRLKCKYLNDINDYSISMLRIGKRRIKLVTKSQCDEQAQKRYINRTMKRIRKLGKKKHDYDSPTLSQAMKRSDWSEWKKAMDTELKQMDEEGVFTDVSHGELTKHSNIIGSMWVLKIKRDVKGNIDKYKARLVALGNQQKPNSYSEVSSSTARSSTIKMLISLQAKTGAPSMVLDVKGAYLKSSIDDTKNI
jgi:hypothetical protein